MDETGWVKQGQRSVGVSHQYCGSVGKQANCQVCVEVVVSDGEIAAPAAGQLYLPQSWTDDCDRCRAAGVPDSVKFATKPVIAMQLLRTMVEDGIEPAPVLADKVYGDCYDFRAGLSCRTFSRTRPKKAVTNCDIYSKSVPHCNHCTPICAARSEYSSSAGPPIPTGIPLA